MWHSVALSSAIPKTQKCKKKTHFIQCSRFGCGTIGAMWRYLTLTHAILKTHGYPQTRKAEKKKRKHCKFQDLDVALCGAIQRYPQTQNIPKNTEFSNFKNWMWHCYVALSSNPTLQKTHTIFKFPGSMWHYLALPDAIPKPQNQRYQISEFGCSTMWLADAIPKPKML